MLQRCRGPTPPLPRENTYRRRGSLIPGSESTSRAPRGSSAIRGAPPLDGSRLELGALRKVSIRGLEVGASAVGRRPQQLSTRPQGREPRRRGSSLLRPSLPEILALRGPAAFFLFTA